MHALAGSRFRPAAAAWVAALAISVFAVAGCDKASHENVDAWMSTEKGPAKLDAAVKNAELDPDLRAHAAQNLILLDRYSDVKAAVEGMPERERGEVMGKLAPRLWESAKFKQGQDGLTMPSAEQNMAKDALFELRALAGPETRATIDGWLIEWLAGGYYEGRAKEGRVPGRQIVRAVGRPAGARLLDSARSIIARPANPDGSRVKIGDELLLALALSGDPEATGFVLDLSVGDFKDETLGARATQALWIAAVQPPAGLEPIDAKVAFAPHAAKLAAILQNERIEGAMVNDAADLIVALGPPACIPPLVSMISFAGDTEQRRWSGAQRAIRCGGAEAIRPVIAAIPTNIHYDRGRLQRYVWAEILALHAKAKIGEEARFLLGEPGWVSRVSGVELLGQLGDRANAKGDAAKVRGLAGDRTVLKGWWGKNSEKKPDPTVGQVATEVASRLEALANGNETK